MSNNQEGSNDENSVSLFFNKKDEKSSSYSSIVSYKEFPDENYRQQKQGAANRSQFLSMKQDPKVIENQEVQSPAPSHNIALNK